MQAELKVADFGLDCSGHPLVPRARGAHPEAVNGRLVVVLAHLAQVRWVARFSGSFAGIIAEVPLPLHQAGDTPPVAN